MFVLFSWWVYCIPAFPFGVARCVIRGTEYEEGQPWDSELLYTTFYDLRKKKTHFVSAHEALLMSLRLHAIDLFASRRPVAMYLR